MEARIKLEENCHRVLIISYSPFSTVANNGKTLSSFFEGYPVEKVAQFSFSGGDCNPAVCDRYFVMTNDDALHRRGGSAYRAEEITVVPSDQSQKKGLRKLFNVFSQKRIPLTALLKNRIWGRADYSEAHKWIKDFAPDVVFFQGFSMSYGYDFALDVCKKNDIPMILELTDDYTHNLYPLSLINRINLKQYKAVFSEAIRYAYKTIVISQAMKETYESQYGGDMVVMMNAVNLEDYVQKQRDPKDYVYAGNVLLNRWKVLRNFGAALVQVDPHAVLTVYTPDIPPRYALRAFSKIPSIRYGGRLTKEALNARLASCGAVLHVEAFDRKNRKITRLSMSTKISEYLACGAKVIAVGPSDVASMKCLKSNSLALCINHFSARNIVEALQNEDVVDYRKNAESFLADCASGNNSQRVAKYITSAKTRNGRD